MGPIKLPDLNWLFAWAIFGMVSALIGGIALFAWLVKHLAWVE